ncbi:histidine phosphatase family protein [Microbacterium sp. NPDC089189]|uniref:SixA phosphatase family protein n=1 Tax=Microbacterium sp. NPDC089189 TaxID=3154972 RepID=UPI00342FA631
MITLAIVRHATAQWADARTSDHERPLNARGRREAPRMAQLLAERGVRPDALLASDALRARTTAEVFGETFGIAPVLLPSLYGASADAVLDTAREAALEAERATIMIVAHDPGLSELATRLAGAEVQMTTCAIASFEWDAADWADIATVAPSRWRLDAPR